MVIIGTRILSGFFKGRFADLKNKKVIGGDRRIKLIISNMFVLPPSFPFNSTFLKFFKGRQLQGVGLFPKFEGAGKSLVFQGSSSFPPATGSSGSPGKGFRVFQFPKGIHLFRTFFGEKTFQKAWEVFRAQTWKLGPVFLLSLCPFKPLGISRIFLRLGAPSIFSLKAGSTKQL